MRAALKDESGGTTAVDRTEAATVLFQGADAATQPQLAQTVGKNGETTVVQTAKPRGSRLSPWAIAAAAVVLIGVGFGVFYAIQNRDNSAAVSAPTQQPSPATEEEINADADIDPATGGSTEEKSAETIEKSADAAIKKNENVIKDKAKTTERANVTEKPKPTPPIDEQYPGLNAPDVPEAPGLNSPDGLFQRPRTGTRVRNLPDGSKIIINRDGSRVLVMADGTRRVLPPGQRVRRRP
jgi:cytoskeletal protein RodZ